MSQVTTPRGAGNVTTKKLKKDKDKLKGNIEKSIVNCTENEDNDISYDNFDSEDNKIIELKNFFERSMASMKADFNEKLKSKEREMAIMKAEFQGKVDSLYEVIKMKDEALGKLQHDIGELKSSNSFLTQETSDLAGRIKLAETNNKSHGEKLDNVTSKTNDLEDRSRRNNVVFFNIPESNNTSTKEDCEDKIINLLISRKFFPPEYDMNIERAHRLGPRKNDSDGRPRPIIVRFCFYKDKEAVIRNGRNLMGSNVRMSEDFSKATVVIHKNLANLAKAAKESLYKDPKKAIVSYKITYRRVILTYTVDKTNRDAVTFNRSFSHEFIDKNREWYIPKERSSY